MQADKFLLSISPHIKHYKGHNIQICDVIWGITPVAGAKLVKSGYGYVGGEGVDM